MVEGSWVGLDVHARTTVASVLDAASGELRVEVGYTEAFIGSDAGATALANEIERDVSIVCGRAAIRNFSAAAACTDALLADAVEQLNAKGATLAAGKLAARG